jgi:hypothetical protein
MAIELSKIPVLSAAKVDAKKVDEAIAKQGGQVAWYRGETLTDKDREYLAAKILEQWKTIGPQNLGPLEFFASSIGCPPSYCKQVLDELDAAAKSEAVKK